jgi:peptidoglycan hydrolase-like protein with peptidoglycan-binding domain/lambda repressor-like predicted transcriptional regulator
MRERYRTLEAMLALGEFSVADLAARSGVSASTIRTILRRESPYVEQIATESTGLHGGRPVRWRVRAETREHLSETLRELENSGAEPWPGEPQEAAQALPAARVVSNTTAAGRDMSITASSDVAVEVIHEKVVPPGPTGQRSLAPSIASLYSDRKLSARKAKLFISYSHRDERYREQLVTHLAGLRRQGVIADWHDRKIVPGQEWRDAIDQNLDAADCVLLLVSSDFLASDYCYSIEMQRTLEKYREGRVLVIPVIVRPADWQHTPLADLQALPKDAKPVVEWLRRDRAWLSVTDGLRRALTAVLAKPPEEENIGRSAPRVSSTIAGRPTRNPTLKIGDRGRGVRRLQRALCRAGEHVDIDGLFRQETAEAVCSLQRSRGLIVDGIAGSSTWAQLPSGAPMPVLLPGARGDVVTQLQRILAEQAHSRWESSPRAATGEFDDSTSAAVKAFQKWNGLASDGIVGDRTWAAPAGESSLEVAVGLKFRVDDELS